MFSHTAMDELTGIDGRLSSKRNIELRKFMVEEKTRAVARDGEQGTGNTKRGTLAGGSY